MKVFKIRKKGTTDIFSSGGADPRWTTKGKTWSSLGHVKSHMGQCRLGRYRDSADYADAEIVEYAVTEVAVTDATTMFQQIHNDRTKKRLKEEAALRKRQEDAEREQLRKLQAKFPNG